MIQVVNPVDSWYERTAARGSGYDVLRNSIEADVCVVGGGLAGLTTALELRRRGLSVVLLEASLIACGASGRNGGFVSNGFALGIDHVTRRVGLEAAQALYALSREGTEFARSTIAKHDPALKMGDGWRVVSRYRNAAALALSADALVRNHAENVVVSSTEETRSILVSERYFESLNFPQAFHIQPLGYALLLARLAVENSVRIFENSGALGRGCEGASHVIHTAHGKVKSHHVVFCVSALDRTIHRASGRAVLPVATYVAVTAPVQQDLIRTSGAVSDTRRAGDYYRLVGGNQILWGGRITTRISEPSHLAQYLKHDMLSVYPGLGNPAINCTWAGLMAYAVHKMPLIGRDHSGQWFATGFGGHGLNTTAMAGLLIARAIAEGDDSYRRFAAFAPDWAFGQLGRLGVQGAYWLMQLKDRLDEAKSRVS